MIKRRILSAFLSLALIAAPMAMGAVSASADGAIYDSLTVVSGNRYYVKSASTGEYLQVGDTAKTTADRQDATSFRMDFTAGKGYQMVDYNGYVLTAASMTQGAALTMERNTQSDNQYWSTPAYSSHEMLMAYAQYGMNIAYSAQAGEVTLNDLTQYDRFEQWIFEEVPNPDTLQLGVYTIYNPSAGKYLNLDVTSSSIVLNDSRPENATKWIVQPNEDGTFSMWMNRNAGYGTFTLMYPGTVPMMVTGLDNPSGHNRIVAEGNNTYRIITSETSLAALGVASDNTGKLLPVAGGARDTQSWVFTYIGKPNDNL